MINAQLKQLSTGHVFRIPKELYNRITDPSLKSNGVRKARAAEPIRDVQLVKRIEDYFLNSNQEYKYRNYMMFVVGINIGRRAGDLLRLKVKDVYDVKNKQVKDFVIFYEQKTGKSIKVYLNKFVKSAIELYLQKHYSDTLNLNDWLFYSRKANKYNEHKIEVKSAWDILNRMAKDLELNMNVGTHTLRKTFSYRYISTSNNKSDALATMQYLLNHSDARTTLTYAGFTDDDTKKAFLELNWEQQK